MQRNEDEEAKLVKLDSFQHWEGIHVKIEYVLFVE